MIMITANQGQTAPVQGAAGTHPCLVIEVSSGGIVAALFGAGTGNADTRDADAIEADGACAPMGNMKKPSAGPFLFSLAVTGVVMDTGLSRGDATTFAVKAINIYRPEHRGDIAIG